MNCLSPFNNNESFVNNSNSNNHQNKNIKDKSKTNRSVKFGGILGSNNSSPTSPGPASTHHCHHQSPISTSSCSDRRPYTPVDQQDAIINMSYRQYPQQQSRRRSYNTDESAASDNNSHHHPAKLHVLNIIPDDSDKDELPHSTTQIMQDLEMSSSFKSPAQSSQQRKSSNHHSNSNMKTPSTKSSSYSQLSWLDLSEADNDQSKSSTTSSLVSGISRAVTPTVNNTSRSMNMSTSLYTNSNGKSNNKGNNTNSTMNNSVSTSFGSSLVSPRSNFLSPAEGSTPGPQSSSHSSLMDSMHFSGIATPQSSLMDTMHLISDSEENHSRETSPASQSMESGYDNDYTYSEGANSRGTTPSPMDQFQQQHLRKSNNSSRSTTPNTLASSTATAAPMPAPQSTNSRSNASAIRLGGGHATSDGLIRMRQFAHDDTSYHDDEEASSSSAPMYYQPAFWNERLTRREVYSRRYRPSDEEKQEMQELEQFLGIPEARKTRKHVLVQQWMQLNPSQAIAASEKKPVSIVLKRGPVSWTSHAKAVGCELILVTRGFIVARQVFQYIPRFQVGEVWSNVDKVMATGMTSFAIVCNNEKTMEFSCPTAADQQAWMNALRIVVLQAYTHSASTLDDDSNAMEEGWQYKLVQTPWYTEAITGDVNLDSNMLDQMDNHDLNKLDSYNQKAPLHYATKLNHVDSMRFLLQAGADPNLPDGYGQTPLQYAEEEKLPESTIALLRSYGGKKPSSQQKSCFAWFPPAPNNSTDPVKTTNRRRCRPWFILLLLLLVITPCLTTFLVLFLRKDNDNSESSSSLQSSQTLAGEGNEESDRETPTVTDDAGQLTSTGSSGGTDGTPPPFLVVGVNPIPATNLTTTSPNPTSPANDSPTASPNANPSSWSTTGNGAGANGEGGKGNGGSGTDVTTSTGDDESNEMEGESGVPDSLPAPENGEGAAEEAGDEAGSNAESLLGDNNSALTTEAPSNPGAIDSSSSTGSGDAGDTGTASQSPSDPVSGENQSGSNPSASAPASSTSIIAKDEATEVTTFEPTNSSEIARTGVPSSSPSTIAPTWNPTEAPTIVARTTSPSESPIVAPIEAPAAPSSDAPTRDPSSPTDFPTFESIDKDNDLLPEDILLFNFLVENSLDGGLTLRNPRSPQYKAFRWLSGNMYLSDYSEERRMQRYALAVLYYTTNGDNWSNNQFWLSDEDECSRWFSRIAEVQSDAVCNIDMQIITLDLDYNNLRGTLPQEIGLLSHLMRLELYGGPEGFLTGSIPTEIAYLTSLESMSLRGNRMVGSMPSELGMCTSLEVLNLSQNRFVGSVPTTIGELTKLKTLSLETNRLEGNLPTQLGTLSRLRSLNTGKNSFSGTLPTEIGKLSELRGLDMEINNFRSTIPTEFGRLFNLSLLHMSDCKLRGSIPVQLGGMLMLESLQLRGNKLDGSIPTQVGLLSNLQGSVDLSSNKLDGPIPSELGNAILLRSLYLNSNQLTGSVPTELASLSRLNTLRIEANNMSGSVPMDVCDIFFITYPMFYADCNDLDCPCCTYCCTDGAGCVCEHAGTVNEFLC